MERKSNLRLTKQKILGFLVLLFISGIFMALGTQAATQSYNLTYDNNGNLIQGIGKYYEYNGLNQLVKVREGNSEGRILEEYLYDHEGQRAMKKEWREDGSNESTYYSGDENVGYAEVRNSSGIFGTVFIYHQGQLVARINPDNNTFYYHPDHLGSTNVVTNASGAVVEETTYEPYGQVLEGGSSRYLFTAKELDRGSDLYYYGARYYDPFTTRFTQADTNIPNIYNPQDLNRYSYVRNNPYKYVDPSGNEPTLSQLGGVKDVVHEIKNIEAANTDLTPEQVLSVVAAQYGGGSRVNSQQAQGTSNFDTRFVYTSGKGFVDQAHFFRSAKYPTTAYSLGGGYFLESLQYTGIFLKGQRESGFSYEDLPSNYLGTQFGRGLTNDAPLSEQYATFMYGIGGTDSPSDIPPNIFNQIPHEESNDILPPEKRSYLPTDKALPKDPNSGIFNRIRNFFRNR